MPTNPPNSAGSQDMGRSAQACPDEKTVDMATSPADMSAGSTVMFPPGTVRLEDMSAPASQGIILQPRSTDDPNDPLNWPNWRKCLNFGLVGFYVLMVSEFINSATPTWGPMQRELGFSDQVLTSSYAIGCAFLAIGAVVLVPFALKFGRRPLYIFSSLVQCGVSVWSAKIQNVADLLLVNILCTGFGALAEVIVQMTIGDVFFVHQRGTLNSLYIWLWQVAVSIVLLPSSVTATPQPSPATLPNRADSKPVSHQANDDSKAPSASRSRDATSPASITAAEEGSQHDLYAVRINPNIPSKTYWQRLAITTTSSSGGGITAFLCHMYQPLILLTTVPAIAYTALAYGILIALQDVMSTSFSLYMTRPPYNFAPNQIGLMNLSKLVGSTIGSPIVGPVSDSLIIWLSRRNNGIYEPEARLWSLVPFLPFIPARAFMFGLGLQNGLPWPIIAVGLALYKLGIAP
ncbi:hypothetical protein ACJ41O_014470 [Fusarium nematophilum]